MKPEVGSLKRSNFLSRGALARLTKQKKERRLKLLKIRNESGDITTKLIEIKRIIGEYYQQLYDNKLDNVNEIPERHKLPKKLKIAPLYDPATPLLVIHLKKMKTLI